MTAASESPAASLTRDEATQRAALLEVLRYDITVDLTGLLDGDTLSSVSTITFDCGSPGATTFVDCVADVRRATLNGAELDLGSVDRGRIPLPDLAAHNELVVEASQSRTDDGAGIQRSVDPSDKLVYVWMSFEPDDARRIWACFDQPDLKAPHAFTVTAPESWTVASNGAPDSVEEAGDGARVWTFPDTPPLSTYVVVVNAGPFYELRREVGGHDLGLYCRQSLARFLDRDADELFDLTARGLAFFGEQFGRPFPQRRYDQVFVPDLGGAMENWGCVTWTDGELYRSTPTYDERSWRAWILLHEMAHMWFGDLVTMRWWDDLWLNEAFASWAEAWCAAAATEFTDTWAMFLADQKVAGYRQDMGPASHPIRGEVPDVSVAMATFDAITYVKGQSVLKQLVAYVGEEALLRGLRSYFERHAWGNATLDDLIGAIATAADRDLSAWTRLWLDRAGTDTIRLDVEGGAGRLVVTAPDGDPRPHLLLIGSYAADGDGLRSVGVTRVETAGEGSEGFPLPAADLHLLNDDDLTFAATRPDPASLERTLSGAHALPTPLSRAVAVSTAFDMMVRGELAAPAFVRCALRVLAVETCSGVITPFLTRTTAAAEWWAPAGERPQLLADLADTALALAQHPDLRLAALQTLARTASSPAHFEVLDAADEHDIAWRALVRRAELGHPDDEVVRALLERDPDPDAATRALSVRAARPEAEAKAEAWQALLVDRVVPAGYLQQQVAEAFWRPGQDDVLAPYLDRYLDTVAELRDVPLLQLGSLIGGMFPVTGDLDFLARAEAIAERAETVPVVRRVLLNNGDQLRRQLRSRAEA